MNGIERNALHISMLSDYKAFIRILGLKQCTHYFFNEKKKEIKIV